jgi:peptide-methionine (S)-S-oxide reductase
MFKFTGSVILMCMLGLTFVSCAQNGKGNNTKSDTKGTVMHDQGQLDTATFAAGCFWCVEAIFQNVEGVKTVASGYSGGSIKNPSYKEVCTGRTGHAEAVQITYDPSKVTYPELLEIFWKTHDPTTLNQQGNDVGTQYRSAIFYHSEQQKELAETYKKKLDGSGAFDKPIVTEISPISNFYKAEDYHQDYYNQNSDQPYCTFVIRPKLDKFEKVFKDKMKKE